MKDADGHRLSRGTQGRQSAEHRLALPYMWAGVLLCTGMLLVAPAGAAAGAAQGVDADAVMRDLGPPSDASVRVRRDEIVVSEPRRHRRTSWRSG